MTTPPNSHGITVPRAPGALEIGCRRVGDTCSSTYTIEKHVKSILGTLSLPPSSDDHRRVLAVITYLNSQ